MLKVSISGIKINTLLKAAGIEVLIQNSLISYFSESVTSWQKSA